MKSYSVLFICAANICRSPMAEYLLNAKVGQNNGDWQIDSAGLWADPGFPVAWNTLQVLQNRGIEAGDHLSKPVTQEILASYNLILTMESGQKEALQHAFPEMAHKVFLFSEMAGENFNIVDPIGKQMVEFEETAKEMEDLIEQGFDRIRHLAQKPVIADEKE